MLYHHPRIPTFKVLRANSFIIEEILYFKKIFVPQAQPDLSLEV